jgi:hypothetical protein
MHIFQLRHGLRLNDSYEVSEALTWFKNHSDASPLYALAEAKGAYITHQNDILKVNLHHGIKEGRCMLLHDNSGQIDREKISIEKLELCIQQSK